MRRQKWRAAKFRLGLGGGAPRFYSLRRMPVLGCRRFAGFPRAECFDLEGKIIGAVPQTNGPLEA
jgi:hypothetical protein